MSFKVTLRRGNIYVYRESGTGKFFEFKKDKPRTITCPKMAKILSEVVDKEPMSKGGHARFKKFEVENLNEQAQGQETKQKQKVFDASVKEDEVVFEPDDQVFDDETEEDEELDDQEEYEGFTYEEEEEK